MPLPQNKLPCSCGKEKAWQIREIYFACCRQATSILLGFWRGSLSAMAMTFFTVDILLLFRRIVECEARPLFPQETHAEFKDLVEECWHQTASKRPSFAETRAKLDCMLVGGSTTCARA